MRRKKFSNLRFKLRSAQDFTSPWKQACVTAKILKNTYHDFVTKVEAGATCTAHTSAIQLFSWWISCLLTWFRLESTQHNAVNFSGWLENIPLKYVNKHELQALCWRISCKCNISTARLCNSAIFFLPLAAWILTFICNHMKHLPAIFIFLVRKHDFFLLEEAWPSYVYDLVSSYIESYNSICLKLCQVMLYQP